MFPFALLCHWTPWEQIHVWCMFGSTHLTQPTADSSYLKIYWISALRSWDILSLCIKSDYMVGTPLSLTIHDTHRWFLNEAFIPMKVGTSQEWGFYNSSITESGGENWDILWHLVVQERQMQKQSLSDSYHNQHRTSNVRKNCIVCRLAIFFGFMTA